MGIQRNHPLCIFVKVGNYPKKPKLHLCKPTINQVEVWTFKWPLQPSGPFIFQPVCFRFATVIILLLCDSVSGKL